MSGSAVFRVDGSIAIGSGHVRRCLVLAGALGEIGWRVRFACRPGTREAVPALARSAFGVVDVHNDEPDELRRTVADNCDLLVLDHYGLNADFERACRSFAWKIVVVDDLARRHDCDLLVDQTPDRNTKTYERLVPSGCNVLAGTDYALLDSRFRQAAERPRTFGAIRRVLVSFGGVDRDGATVFALDALKQAKLGAEVDVVLGTPGSDIAQVRKLAAALQPQGRVHIGVDDMASLMQQADLAIGAGGVSALERCCLGLPSLLVTVADNQRGNADALARRGAAMSLGPIGSFGIGRLVASIGQLAADPTRRQAMAEAGQALCDGRGVERLCRALCTQVASYAIRLATADDAERIFKWRNDPVTRSMFCNSDPVSWETHAAWFAKRLASPDTVMLISMFGGCVAGVVRFDRRDDGAAEVSINVAPEFRGKGVGRHLLIEGCASVARQGFTRVFAADIKPGNAGSRRIFEAAGFSSVSHEPTKMHYRLELAGAARHRALPR